MNSDRRTNEAAARATRDLATNHRSPRAVRRLAASALCCLVAGAAACGGISSSDPSADGEPAGGGGGDLNSEIVEMLRSEEGGSLPEDQASCIARKVIASGVNEDDIAKAKASDEGLAVSSKILDAFDDATMICVPGASASSLPAGF